MIFTGDVLEQRTLQWYNLDDVSLYALCHRAVRYAKGLISLETLHKVLELENLMKGKLNGINFLLPWGISKLAFVKKCVLVNTSYFVLINSKTEKR